MWRGGQQGCGLFVAVRRGDFGGAVVDERHQGAPITANDLSKSGIVEKAQAAGFRTVQFTDGYDGTWKVRFEAVHGA